jgi:hypothetical protein
MLGAAAFKSAAEGAASSVSDIGKASETTTRQTADLERGTGKLRQQFGKWGKRIAAAGAIAAVGKAAKDAVTETMDLAKSTIALERATGLDTKTASGWAEITRVRGIQTKQLQVGFTKLSKVMEAARGGNEKAAASLAQVGVNQDQIAKGDVSGAVLRIADAFQSMTNPAEKAAAAQNLLGRAGVALLPVLNSGSAGIQEQLDLVNKYGATLGNTAGAKELIARQRELKYASDGLKVSLGTALLPAILSVTRILTQLTAVMQPLLRNTTALKILIGALAYAFVVLKVNALLAAFGMTTLSASILLIPLAIAAIGIALVIAYRKVKWFRDAVNAVADFIKAHWRAILFALFAPLPALIILAIKHFDKLKSYVRALPRLFVSVGKSIVRALIEGIKAAPHAIVDAIKSLLPGGKVGRAASKLIGGVVGSFQHGGIVPRTGIGLVGESGPELVSLTRGQRVVPLPAGVPMPTIEGGGTVVAKVYLQNREIAQGVAQHTSNVMARR